LYNTKDDLEQTLSMCGSVDVEHWWKYTTRRYIDKEIQLKYNAQI